jgi:hypothetical protein
MAPCANRENWPFRPETSALPLGARPVRPLTPHKTRNLLSINSQPPVSGHFYSIPFYFILLKTSSRRGEGHAPLASKENSLQNSIFAPKSSGITRVNPPQPGLTRLNSHKKLKNIFAPPQPPIARLAHASVHWRTLTHTIFDTPPPPFPKSAILKRRARPPSQYCGGCRVSH